MAVQIGLEKVEQQCSYVPLAVLGYCLTRCNILQPVWSELQLTGKVYQHTPQEKLQDVLVALLLGCRSLSQVNLRLRPEKALAQAWQRPQFAEQSTLSRTLDQLSAVQIDQLRQGNLQLIQRHSQLQHHDWRQPVYLDIDPTSLITSKRAEASRKGWVSGKRNHYCRHIIRFTLADYHESLLSLAYAGNRHGYEHLKPAFEQLLQAWPWSQAQRQQIIVRSDAEQGTDENLAYLLWKGFQVLCKGYSGKRTQAWIKQVPAEGWQMDPTRPFHWAAPAPKRLRLGRSINSYLLRWHDQRDKELFATLHSTLSWPMFELWRSYESRAATEIEIRSDKSGLRLGSRRKHSLNAMEAWILLTDLAHNLLAWLRPWMLTDSAFAQFGPLRVVNDLLTIPGQVFIEEGRLTKVTLWETHPYALEMQDCLRKLLKTFDLA